MKKILLPFFIILFVSLIINGQNRVSFTTASEAVEFISNCVEINDSTTLFNACTINSDSSKLHFNSHYLQILKSLNQETPLSKLYGGKKFPIWETQFHLGGHGFKWGHIHINFIKKNKRWYIHDISQCL